MSERFNRELYSKGKKVVGNVNEPSLANTTPCNCKTPCVYGKTRPFCFPCMAKILGEMRGQAA